MFEFICTGMTTLCAFAASAKTTKYYRAERTGWMAGARMQKGLDGKCIQRDIFYATLVATVISGDNPVR